MTRPGMPLSATSRALCLTARKNRANNSSHPTLQQIAPLQTRPPHGRRRRRKAAEPTTPLIDNMDLNAANRPTKAMKSETSPPLRAPEDAGCWLNGPAKACDPTSRKGVWDDSKHEILGSTLKL